MSAVTITVRDGQPAHTAEDAADLLRVLGNATAESEKVGRLGIIDVKSERGDILSLVVGGAETVLGFTSAENQPPYFASRGASAGNEPVLACYQHFEHYTEFPRHAVIPQELGMAATLQFLQTGKLPTCVQWQEV